MSPRGAYLIHPTALLRLVRDILHSCHLCLPSVQLTFFVLSASGVDFYLIGERGEQFGPFGALSPMQKFNQTGRGIFRCSDTNMQSGNANVARQLQVPRGLPGL